MLRLIENRRSSVGILIVVGALLVSLVVVIPRFAGAAVQAPTSPPAGTQLCNGGPDSSLLAGPSTPPAGAVTVPAGDDSPYFEQPYVYALPPATTYWFAPGVHTIGTSQYGQIDPSAGDTFIGAPGAILSGQGANDAAFEQKATGVTIEYLTIEDFVPGADSITVNHDTGPSWTIKYNTIKDNTGAGVGLGTNDVVEDNCLTANDQYGFNVEGGSSDITLSNNEISSNDTNGTYDQSSFVVSYAVSSDVATIVTKVPMNLMVGRQIDIGASGQCNFEWCTNLSLGALNGEHTITEVRTSPLTTSFQFAVSAPDVSTTSDQAGTVADAQVAEGGSGAGKFWNTSGAVVTDNYVHDNGDTGFWLDTDNTGFDISGNYIAHNWSDGLIYEISYNGSVQDNTFLDNAWGSGPSPNLGGFPDASVYLNGSGGDANVALPAGGFGYQGTSLLIENNDFVDNWGGVVLYENSDRGCSLSSDNYCTLDNPSTYTMASCAQNLPGAVIGGTRSAYADACRWKTQNVTVSDNTFDFTPSDIGSDCTTSVYCGFNGLFGSGGSTPGAMDSVGFTGGSQYTGSSFAVSSAPSTLTVSSTQSCGGQSVQNPGETCFAPGSPSAAYLDINGDVFSYTGVSATSFTGVSYDAAASTGTATLSATSCGGPCNVSQYWNPGANYPFAGDAIPNQISNNQNNAFSDNTYCGAWNFVGFAQGNSMTPSQWTSGESNAAASGDTFPGQDAGSTFATGACATLDGTTTTASPPTTTTPDGTTTTSPDGTTTTTSTSTTTTPDGTTTTTTTEPSPPPPPPQFPPGYDLVGQDGGVFCFPTGQFGGFFGSLPGRGISVDDIVGLVPSPDDRGYFLVGADGGVFAFGDAPFLGSLPGLGISVDDISGILATPDNRGYLLVDRHGGVFAFGDASFQGSLPGRGVNVDDIIGMAASGSGQGYWLVAADGTVYAFGNAAPLGSATGTPSPVAGISSTGDGGGYWIVTKDGQVYTFGDAGYYKSLPGIGVTPALPVVGLVPTSDSQGYWLVASDGGIFAFGDAGFVGSPPGIGVHVTNIAGAVPTNQ